MSNVDQMDVVRSDLVSDCHEPDTALQSKVCRLHPLPADRPFGACSPRKVLFKAERSANGKFIVSFADGSTVEVTEAQLQSEQRFRHCLRVKLGKEFAAQNQSSWECDLAFKGIIGWTDRAIEYDRHVEERLERGWQDWLETMAGVHYGPEA